MMTLLTVVKAYELKRNFKIVHVWSFYFLAQNTEIIKFFFNKKLLYLKNKIITIFVIHVIKSTLEYDFKVSEFSFFHLVIFFKKKTFTFDFSLNGLYVCRTS